MRSHGKGILLQLLSDGEPHSKSELAQQSKLSLPRVSKILETWTAESLLTHTLGNTHSWGKHSGYYSLDPEHKISLAINIRPDYIEATLCNTFGQPIDLNPGIIRHTLYGRAGHSAGIEELGIALLELIKGFPPLFSQILVASHGTVIHQNANSGIEILLPHLGWKNTFPIEELLKKTYELPVLVESDCMTLSYNYLYRDLVEDFIFLHLSYGIGASLVLENQVWGSKHDCLTPGQIGHTPITDHGELCKCGNHGCLETTASISAIETQVKRSLQRNHSSSLKYIMQEEQREVHFVDIAQAVLDGDSLAQRICSSAIHNIGLSLVSVIHLINPSRIYIGGELGLLGDFLIQELQLTISQCSIYKERENTELSLCTITENSMFRGLALMALQHKYGSG